MTELNENSENRNEDGPAIGTSQPEPLQLDLANQPTGIAATPILSISGKAFVRLVVNGTGGRQLMESSQDLEDTLALGAFVVDAVSDVLEGVSGVVKDAIWRDQIGDSFEEYLAQTEAATHRIRALLERTSR